MQSDFLIYTANYRLFCKMHLRFPVKLFQYCMGAQKASRVELHGLRGLLVFLCIPLCPYVCNSYVFSLFHLVRFGLNSGMFAFTFSVCPLKWVGRWENLGGDGKRKQWSEYITRKNIFNSQKKEERGTVRG